MKDFDLEAGSTSYYRDVVFYDDEYKDRREDVAFYVEQYLAQHSPVLELGVGSGRIAIKAVRQGATVEGVDLSETMLKAAEEKRLKLAKAKRDQLTLHHADMRDFHLQKTFSLITCPFNAFQHLYTRSDVEACLTCVKEHLNPDGTFIFDVLVPDLEYLTRSPYKTYVGVRFKHATYGVHYRYSERTQYDPIKQINQMWFLMDRDGDEDLNPSAPQHIECQLSHRCFFPAELEALLYYNGFEVFKREGDFNHDPLLSDSESQVLFCRMRK